MTPSQALKHFFGYDHFRSGQTEIIEAILSKKDTLAILPTGGGKSVCYQIPGLIFEGQTLVISPLISLMSDQVQQLLKRHISAVFINSSLPTKELKKIINHLDQYKFIYVAPERLNQVTFQKACQQLTISLIAIDEAHCISLWGHDFRPSYLQIQNFIKKLSHRPTIAAFTATATTQVKNDILSSLTLKTPQIFTNSFARHNLTFFSQVTNKPAHKEILLLKIIKTHLHQNGVIYCATRKSTQYVAQLISHFFPKIKTGYYHGGLNSETREKIQQDFINGQIKIIVATNAFGMGVDKSDVRFVIHFQVPGCLENYYQEAGRAGRDRKPADCYLLADQNDLTVHLDFINQSPDNHKKTLIYQLQQMIEYVNFKGCKQNFILQYFGEKPQHACHHCDWCCCLRSLTINSPFKSYLEILEPKSTSELLKIPGIGDGWVKFNHQFAKSGIIIPYDHPRFN